MDDPKKKYFLYTYKIMAKREFKGDINVPGNAYFTNIIQTGSIQATYYDMNDADTYDVDSLGVKDYIILVSFTGAVKHVVLPDPGENQGRLIWVHDVAANAAAFSIFVEFGEGPVSVELDADYDTALFLALGDAWVCILKGAGAALA